MTPRTRIFIGLSVIGLGLVVVALALQSDDSGIRRVEQVMAEPLHHASGTYTLLGIPQPRSVPVTASSGTVLADNPEFANTTASTVAWTTANGERRYSTRVVTVEAEGDGTWRWTWTNTTRALPTDPQPMAFETTTWTSSGRAPFPIEAFDDGDGQTPRVWSVYDGTLKEAMQPKPSQFTGRLWATLPDGRPVPDGVFVYQVDEGGYKAGCSSKFLPPETEEKYADESAGDA